MNNFKKIGLSLAVITALGFSGCGSSSSDDDDNNNNSSSDNTETGTFVDAPVKGLKYVTTTQNGFTNDKGEFKYKAGEKVEFKLGNLSLGKVEAGGLITPYTIAGVTNGTDNDLSTNIALLLQNLDANRSNTSVLDLSKLKDFNFSDINLSVDTTTMEAKLSNKLTAGDFDNFIDKENKKLLDSATVKEVMKTFVQKQESEKLSINNILNKDFTYIGCSELLGCKKEDRTFHFTKDKIIGKYQNESFSKNYTVTDNIIKIVWDEDENDIEYIKILSISSNSVSICSKESSQKDAKNCAKPTNYYATSSYADTLISTLDSSNPNKLNGSLVTNFSEIQNKSLYQISVWDNSIHDENISIDSNGDYSGDFNDGSNYHATFNNGILHVTGYNSYDEEDVDDKYKLTKYSLKGKTINAKYFATEEVFDNDDIEDYFGDKKFTFNSGNMYCHVLWDECWLDEDAYNQIKEQSKK